MGRVPPSDPLTVFISARIQEMATERLAAGNVIASMRLRPVLFEHTRQVSGARPVFLEAARTCDIFVGIYGNEYGDGFNGGPSPIEQEFLETLQAPLMPRLLFVRRSRNRQRKLHTFLQRAAPHATLAVYDDYHDLAARVKRSLNVLLAASFREVGSIRLAAIEAQRPKGATRVLRPVATLLAGD